MKWIINTLKKNNYLLLFIVLFFLQLIFAFYICSEKTACHIDEYYTYFSANGHGDFNIEDNHWNNTDKFFTMFSVKDNERFTYANVIERQSNDVHPPLHYLLLHTLCSLRPYSFTKWYGLAINLFLFCIQFWTIKWLVTLLTNNNRLALACCLIWGSSIGILSSIVFIRMYYMLGTFILLFVLIHSLKEATYLSKNSHYFTALFFCCLFGFLTHHYFAVFIFFFSGSYIIYCLFKTKNFISIIPYCLTLLFSFIASLCIYPATISQIFGEKRGADAISGLFDLQSTLSRLQYFYKLLNQYAFSNFLSIILLIILLLCFALLIDTALTKKSIKQTFFNASPIFYISWISIIGFFFITAQTSLMLGWESYRYISPIVPCFIVLIILTIYYILKKLLKTHVFYCRFAIIFFTSAIFAVNLYGICTNNILFLYSECKSGLDFANNHKSSPVLFLYSNWNTWNISEEIMTYENIYFININNMPPITDEKLICSEELIVYIQTRGDGIDKDIALNYIEQYRTDSICELHHQTISHDIYYLHK